MSLRIQGSNVGANSPQQVNSTPQVDATPQVDDSSIGATDPVSKKNRASKKGIADFNDSFEATPQNPQTPPGLQQVPGVQNSQQAAEAKASGVEGAAPQTRISFGNIGDRKRERIDEDGYKWTSWEFEPPTVKGSDLLKPDDPLAQEALDRLAEMWKDAADKAQFSNIRA